MKKIGLMLSMFVLIFSIDISVVNAAEADVQEVRLCAVGDNIVHSRIIKSGEQEDGTRDYSDIYRYYDEYLDDYDVCIVNQETVFVEDESDFSAYPRFGGPEEIGIALMDSGFNVVTTATNHVLDKGYDALWDYHHFWTGWGIEPVGTYTNSETYDLETGEYVNARAVYMTRNGIKIGMLNYTYGLNGQEYVLDNDHKYMVATLYDKELIKSEMEFVRDRCDVLIVFPHW